MTNTPINNDINGFSRDLISDNISAIRKILPHVVHDSGVDFDALKQALGGVVDNENHYNFTWYGKRKSERLAYSPSRATLLPCVGESKNWDDTQNILIEGDNLEVLKLLQKSYANKIKMIYIDPPYNTGNDFVYNDDFSDNLKNYLQQTGQITADGEKTHAKNETAGRIHTNWLNMIYPRLLLARNLLAENGVIFISIDDNEQANLKKICDEIFGAENTLINTIWAKGNAQNDAKNIQKNHEYIIGYAKSIENISLQEKIEKRYKAYKDEHGVYYLGSGLVMGGGASGTLNGRPFLGYTIYYNKNTGDKIALQDYDVELARTSNDDSIYKDNISLIEKGYIAIRPAKNSGALGCWKWGLDKFNENKHLIHISDNYTVYRKEYIAEKYLKGNLFSKKTITLSKNYPLKSICDFSSASGTKNFKDAMEKKVFDNPKPVSLLQRFIDSNCTKNDIILDFFAGSGTTAHAVMALNAQDGGNRKCISIQLPEQTDEKSEAYKAGYTNIAQITKERIRRAGDKIVGDTDSDLSNLDIGFKVFKLHESNIKKWHADYDTIATDLFNNVDNMLSHRTDMDKVTEIALKYGLHLHTPIIQHTHDKTPYYTVSGNDGIYKLFVFLQPDTPTNITDSILNEPPEHYQNIKVVFADNCFDNSDKATIYHTLHDAGVDGVSFL